MINKQGITVTVMVITVIILIILAGTITFSVSSTINYSNLSTWANEIVYIQDVVDEQLKSSSILDTTIDNIIINTSELSQDIIQQQFKDESIGTDNILSLRVLDLGKLRITNTKYGNQTTQTDVYAISEKTGRVYYVKGLEIENDIYYTVTDGLNNRFGLKTIANKLSSIVFMPSEIGYTNKPITVIVKVPNTYTKITITTSNNNIQIGPQQVQENVYLYSVNTNLIASNYTITVSYNDGTKDMISKYEVKGYDITKPTIEPITTANFVYKETKTDVVEYITNITAVDESGIKIMKYTIGEISEADAKTYFANNGSAIIDGKIKLNITNTVYTVYAEDNAGNFSIQIVDVLEKVYAIYSEQDNSLTFVRTSRKLTVGSIYNGKEITELYTGFESQSYDNSKTYTPWYDNRTKILSVTIENAISPSSTQYWFDGFINCSNLDLVKLDTSKATSLSHMFRETGSNSTVTNFKITGTDGWDTKNVKYMVGVFKDAGKNATTWNIGDLSNWNLSNVNNVRDMFIRAGANATKWDIGDLSNWNVSKVEYMANMFYYAGNKAEKFDVGNLDNWNVSLVTTMKMMFNFAGENATTWNVGNLSKWKTTKLKDMHQMFKASGTRADKWDIGNIGNWNVSQVTDMYQLFQDAGKYALEWNIGNLDNWNVGNVQRMGGMFSNAAQSCNEFNIGNLKNWNTAKVNEMAYMFQNTGTNATIWNIGELDSWDVSGIPSMAGMFSGAASNATEFNIGNLNNWDTASIQNMGYMFQNAGKNSTTWNIGILDSWNVSSVKIMAGMFSNVAQNCKEFNIGTLKDWDTSNVTNMEMMFSRTAVNADYYMDLSGWKVPLVTSYSWFNSGVATKVISPDFK